MWTAGCGVALTLDRATSGWILFSLPPTFGSRALQIGSAIVYGAAIAIVALFIWRRLRRRTVESPQPGHWMLLLASIGALADFGTHLAARAWNGDVNLVISQADWLRGQFAYYACAALAASVILAFARPERRWLVCYIAILLMFTTLLAVYLFVIPRYFFSGREPISLAMLFMAAGSSLCGGLAIWAAAGDVQKGISRDWLHWTGVAAGLGLALVQWMNYAIWVWAK